LQTSILLQGLTTVNVKGLIFHIDRAVFRSCAVYIWAFYNTELV